MRWSLKIAQVAGIGIFIHWTFLILLAWIAWMRMRVGDDLWGVLHSIGFVLTLFGCVVLHELGHALTAKRYGIPTRDITLLPIGGVARLERMPEEPWQEFWVAVAGPAVNVVIAGLLLIAVLATGELNQLEQMQEAEAAGEIFRAPFLTTLMAANIILVLFNLLPAFPMDGGRVLRALLSMKMSRVRATGIAAAIGQGMAILFGIIGLFHNPFLLFIAIFVFLGAQAEAQAVEMRAVFEGAAVHDAMTTRFRSLSPGDTLRHAVDELLAGHQQDFPVLEDGRVIGLLHRNKLIEAFSSGRHAEVVRDVMSADCPVVQDRDRLDQAVQLMQTKRCTTLPVLHDGRLVGLLTSENVGEWTMVQAALRDREEPKPLESVGVPPSGGLDSKERR